MAVYSCDCLNVTIKANEAMPHDVEYRNASTMYGLFFMNKLEKVYGEIKTVYPEFISELKSPYGDIKECMICRTKTHATDVESRPDAMLACLGKLNDSKKIKEIKNHASYSNLYKIVLRGAFNNNPNEYTEHENLGLNEEEFEVVTTMQSVATNQFETLLNDSRQNMNRAIRKFEETERSKFNALESKITIEKAEMMRLIRRMGLEKTNRQLAQDNDSTDSDSAANSRRRRRRSKKMSTKRTQSTIEGELDENLMFGDVGDGMAAMNLSDKDRSSSDDAFGEEAKEEYPTGSFYSASMPQKIAPRPRVSSHVLDEDSDSSFDPIHNESPNTIMDNMTRMTQSLQNNDGTQLFGPRPPKKVNKKNI